MVEWILRRVAFSLIASAAILSAIIWASANQTPAGEKPPAIGSPAWLAEACKPAPVGDLPTAVVVRPAGKGNTVLTNDPTLIHESLEQVFNGVDHGHEVVDFCR